MTRHLAWDASFVRAFKRKIRRDPILQTRILGTLKELAENPFQSGLKAHKLRGRLEGLWACWVEYDCRVIFAFEPDPSGGEDMIVLIDIGSHEEVY
jgi:mRNA-degrading endonuclease YafQ of YafQ-DinJ toxin-antitoxin module